VPVTLRDARDSPEDCAWIRAAYRDYLSELSASRSGTFPALGGWPDRNEEFLSGWFLDPGAEPFVILADGLRAGFALVVHRSASDGLQAGYRMSEFFIARAARRRGVGARAAALLFSRFQGDWEVLEDEGNGAALAFWRRVIGTQTAGRYRETRQAGEVCQRFRTSVRPAEGPT